MDYPDAGIAFIGITGLLFIISREFWLNLLIKQFQNKRFTIAEGFRNK
jgi:hypothetical protein